MAEYNDISYAEDDGVAIITLNRPERLNSFTIDMLEGWFTFLHDAWQNPDIGAIVVTGSGRAFSAGADTGDLAEGRTPAGDVSRLVETRHVLRDHGHRIPRLIATMDKPYIAAVNGAAAGSGMDMASMADIRFASDHARFRMAYTAMGLVPGEGGCYYLPRIVGIANALDLIWTSRIIDAEEALRIGYVTRVIPHDQLLEETVAYAKALARGPRVAIELSKRLLYNSLNTDLNSSLDAAQLSISLLFATEDAREGPRAFLEKREPQFKGR